MASVSDAENPIEEAVADDAREAKRGRYGWLSLIVAAVLGLFYAYDVWEAVGNMINLPAFYDSIGVGSKHVPWWLLWIGVLIPVVVFLLAFVIGRRRNIGEKAVVFIVGLALAAGLGIGVLALEDVLRPVVVVVQN
ncbi:MAG: hypothetical protein JWP19_626 [Rhodoglobus sp.]|nr:hypothetical protein [Rhodoglobus sp.]